MAEWKRAYRVHGGAVTIYEVSRTEWSVTARRPGKTARGNCNWTRYQVYWFDQWFADTKLGAIEKALKHARADATEAREKLRHAESAIGILNVLAITTREDEPTGTTPVVGD